MNKLLIEFLFKFKVEKLVKLNLLLKNNFLHLVLLKKKYLDVVILNL